MISVFIVFVLGLIAGRDRDRLAVRRRLCAIDSLAAQKRAAVLEANRIVRRVRL